MGGKVWHIKAQVFYDKGRLDEKKDSDQRTIRVYQNCIARGMSETDAIAISEIPDELLKKIKK